MNKNLEIIIRVNDKSEVSQDEIIFSKTVNQAIEVEDIGLKHSEQLQILREMET